MADHQLDEEAVFEFARQIESAEMRDVYLQQVCGDNTAVAERVRGLLAIHEQEPGFLEAGPVETGATFAAFPIAEKPGTMIGRYKLLQQIGEGGFGVVFMAEQVRPVRRKVALKIIKPGMDTREVIARFEAERQALALMDHPNIAKVLDAGATENGRSYFVMELVKGIRLTDFCDSNGLSTQERLDLFVTVCRAVQHAHQKGIVHRDLKPSNVMVTLHDNKPVAKIIDFGVSKAISQQLTEKTLFTAYGQMVGTPVYMSPEQAQMSGLDIDTRSDIYSLGVIIYELLTGTTPLDSTQLRNTAYAELQRLICEEEAPTPSSRLSTLGEALAKVARHRDTDPYRLTHLVRGDLDWIVMKALEKDRNRRYETANGLARDIQRHLENEPVAARPPSTWYRFQKLARRNKVAFATASAVFLALAVGLGAAVLGLSEAIDQRRFAQDERDLAERARRVANQERTAADQARHKAEELRQQAATRADELARQNYLIHLANADRALLENDYVGARIQLNACPDEWRGWEHTFLEQRLQTVTAEFPGSEKPIYALDGKVIAIGAAASADENKACVWDVDLMRCVDQFEHNSKLISLALSPDEKLLAGGAYDGELVLWDYSTGEKKWIVKENDDRFDGLAFSPNGNWIAAANKDGTLKVFVTTTGAVKFELEFDHQVRKVMFSTDGKWLAAGFAGAHESPVLIDVSTWTIASRFPIGGYAVPTFSPDGRIATGRNDGRITLWQWDGEELVEDTWWQSEDFAYWDLEFSADGTYLVSSQAGNRDIEIWEVNTGRKLASFNPQSKAHWLTPGPQGEIAFCADTKAIRMWRHGAQTETLSVKPLHHGLSSLVRFSPNGRRIAAGSAELASRLAILDADSGRQVSIIPVNCRNFSWLPDSEHVAVCSEPQHELELYEVATSAIVQRYPANTDLTRPHVAQVGSLLMTIGTDGTVTISDAHSVLRQGERAFRPPSTVSVDPKGDLLAADPNLSQQDAEIWSIRNRSLVRVLPTQGRWITFLKFTKDSHRLFVGSDGGMLTLHDVYSPHDVRQFTSHSRRVTAMALSPDEKQVVSSDDTGRAIVWDLESFEPLITLLSTADTHVVSLDWSSDSRRIVAGNSDGTVLIWTLPTGP